MTTKRWLLLIGIILFHITGLWGCATETVYTRPEAPGRVFPEDLRGLQLEMVPDPVREGQRLRFYLTLSNRSPYSGRINLFIKDQDQLVAEAYDILIQPGQNRIDLPWTGYRFSRQDHCFVVEVDIAGTRRPLDLAKRFCAQRTDRGWTLAYVAPPSPPPPPPAPPPPPPPPPPPVSIGPFFVEDLWMSPDPIRQKQEIRFKVKLRNDGKALRANIRIQDKNEVVLQVENVLLARGIHEYSFPYTGYIFRRLDHCFTVVVDVERTLYPVEAKRKFCARHITGSGWTLRP